MRTKEKRKKEWFLFVPETRVRGEKWEPIRKRALDHGDDAHSDKNSTIGAHTLLRMKQTGNRSWSRS